MPRCRVQLSLSLAELALIDDWRFEHRQPSRVAAIRRLLRLGLQSNAKDYKGPRKRSQDFRVLDPSDGNRRRADNRVRPP